MQERVISILTEYTEMCADEITASSSLTADLGMSSLDIVDVVLAFEEEFGIEIPDEDIRKFATVEDVVKYLEDDV